MNASERSATTRTDTQSHVAMWGAMIVLVIAAILLVGAFFIGVMHWTPLQTQAAAAGSTPAAVPDAAATQFEYFPDQYVNQATRVEEPIPTF